MEFEQVYVVTTVAETHLQAVLDALANAGAGVIGHYTHCSFALAGMGRFKPDADARPTLGVNEHVNMEAEIRVETFCSCEQVRAVTAALRAAHPYEEPVIYLLPMLREADFLKQSRSSLMAKLPLPSGC